MQRFTRKLMCAGVAALFGVGGVLVPSPAANAVITSNVWAQYLTSGTNKVDFGDGAAFDGYGHVYVVGTTTGVAAGAPEGSAGDWDAFITKYSTSGARIWTHQLGSALTDYGTAVAVDKSGNAYVAGHTNSTLPTSSVANAGGIDAFLAKYAADGTRQWVRQLGTVLTDKAQGVGVDGTGNAYITGETGATLPTSPQAHAGQVDAFVAKYSSSGSRQWVTNYGGPGADVAGAIAVDAAGNSIITGAGASMPGATEANAGFTDIFVTKFNSSGTRQWAHQLGTFQLESGRGVALDTAGSVYITGWSRGNFEPNAGNSSVDIVIAKYSAAGAFQWVHQFGTPGTDEARAIAVDDSGNALITGEVGSTLPGSLDVNPAGYDAFLIQYASDGTRQSVRQFGGALGAHGRGVTLDKAGNVFIAGEIHNSVVSSTTSDMFIAKYRTDAPVVVPMSAAEDVRLQQIATYLGTDKAGALRAGIGFLAYINGIVPPAGPTPVVVDPPAVPLASPVVTVSWSAVEVGALEDTMLQYQIGSADAHRFAFSILSFILGLGGH